jgi:N6-L-threonylcarbamoyladenine synthase
MRHPLEYEVLGTTRDDAAGEAFDKIAKLLGLGYPGGPVIQKTAQGGTDSFVEFPVCRVPGYEFSFSGLKTAVLVYIREQGPDFVRENLPHILASFQRAVVEALVSKTLKALSDYGIRTLLLAGGVAANRALRERFSVETGRIGVRLFVPPLRYCTDNAAMIARAGHERLVRGMSSPLTLSPEPRLPL